MFSRVHPYNDRSLQISTISSIYLATAISRSKEKSPTNTMKLMVALSSVLVAICHAASAKLGLKFDKRQSAFADSDASLLAISGSGL